MNNKKKIINKNYLNDFTIPKLGCDNHNRNTHIGYILTHLLL